MLRHRLFVVIPRTFPLGRLWYNTLLNIKFKRLPKLSSVQYIYFNKKKEKNFIENFSFYIIV